MQSNADSSIRCKWPSPRLTSNRDRQRHQVGSQFYHARTHTCLNALTSTEEVKARALVARQQKQTDRLLRGTLGINRLPLRT